MGMLNDIAILEPNTPPPPACHALKHEKRVNYHRDRPVSMRTNHPPTRDVITEQPLLD